MHSFQPSRGRILFETLCAWIIAASFALAWMDLGSPAFLPAAGVAALYGLVHLFDMRRPKPIAAVPDVAPVPGAEAGPPARGAAESAPVTGATSEAPEPAAIVEVADPPVAKPRKKRSRKAPVLVEVVEPETAEPVAQAEPVALEVAAEPEPEVVETPFEAVPDMPSPVAESDASEWPEDHAPVTPLFEPQPLVRQQRTVFGRKAG